MKMTIKKSGEVGVTPKVGVMNGNTLDWIHDEIDTGIDIVYEEALADHLKTIRHELENQVYHHHPDYIEEKIEEEEDNFSQDYENDYRRVIFGDWKKGSDGKYHIDKDGKNGWAAEYSNDTNVVSVVYSRTCALVNQTSPCYVMGDGTRCGDLDTPITDENEGVWAYCFTEDEMKEAA